MLALLRRILLQNLGLKLTALILSLVIYAHVFSTQIQEFTVDIPLLLTDLPPGMMVTGQVPEKVRVRVRGPGREVLELRARKIWSRVSVAGAGEGRFQRPIVPDDIVLPPDINVEVVEVVSPTVLDLVFDRAATKKLPVFARIVGSPAPRHLVSGPVRVEPDSVLLEGPERVLDTVEFLRTAEVSIARATRPLRAEVGLELPPETRARPPRVTVVVPVERLVVRSIEGLPVEVLKSRNIRKVTVEPPTGSVEVVGPESVVASLRPEDLHLQVDARNLRPGTHVLLVSVTLRRPLEDLVTVEPGYPERFRVTLE
jgi:hypothetical protein